MCTLKCFTDVYFGEYLEDYFKEKIKKLKTEIMLFLKNFLIDFSEYTRLSLSQNKKNMINYKSNNEY